MALSKHPKVTVARRQLLKTASLAGLALPLLVACQQAAPTPTATQSPATATRAPEATKPPAPAVTRAPEATKPPAATPVPPTATRPAAAPTLAGEQPRKGGTALLTTGDDMQSPGPWQAGSTHDYRFKALHFDQLFILDPNTGGLIPRLGEKLIQNAEGTEFTLNLKKGLQWNDGQPLTAEDVVWSLHTQWSSKLVPLEAPGSAWIQVEGLVEYQKGEIDKIPGIAKVDDQTVKIKLKKASTALRNQIVAYQPQPKHVWGDTALDKLIGNPNWIDRPVTAGPFKLVKYLNRQYAEYERNPHFYDPVYLDRVIVRIAEYNAAIAALEAGEVHLVTYLSFLEANRLRTNTNIVIKQDPEFRTWGLYLNYKHAEVKNPKVREALQYLFDREGYMKTVLGGYGNVQVKPGFTPGSWPAAPELKPYPFDPAKAKQLLKDAGVDFNKKIGAAIMPANKPRADFAAVMQSNFRDIGIQMDIVSIEEPVIGQNLLRKSDQLWFLLAYIGGTTDPWIDVLYYKTTNPTNWGTHFNNIGSASLRDGKTAADWIGYVAGTPETDRLIEKVQTLGEPEKAKPVFYDIDRWIYKDCTSVPFVAPTNIQAWNKKLHGPDNFMGNGQLLYWYRPDRWWMDA